MCWYFTEILNSWFSRYSFSCRITSDLAEDPPLHSYLMTNNDKRRANTRKARQPKRASQVREELELSFLYFRSAGSGTFRVVVLPRETVRSVTRSVNTDMEGFIDKVVTKVGTFCSISGVGSCYTYHPHTTTFLSLCLEAPCGQILWHLFIYSLSGI